jgi:poly-gamma-glutamate capsule biosynthesis protein CapA/YwtB (metallophosphatase superfamily)
LLEISFFDHKEKPYTDLNFSVTEVLKDYEIFALNLEGPICRCKDSIPQEKFSTLRMEPDVIKILKKLGVNIVFLANNHTADYGERGILETIEILKNNNIKFVGAGTNLAEAFSPLILELNHVKIGLVNFTTVFTPQSRATAEKVGIAGVRMKTRITITPYDLIEEPGAPYIVDAEPIQEDLDYVIKIIKTFRNNVDLLLVYVHWGIGALPFSSIVLEYQKKLGRTLIDAGATLVIGSHPHILLPVEKYRDRLIFYSLGNFVFSYQDPRLSFSNVGGILRLDLESMGVRVMPICLNSNGLPEFCKRPYEKIYELFSFITKSEELGVKIKESEKGWLEIV